VHSRAQPMARATPRPSWPNGAVYPPSRASSPASRRARAACCPLQDTVAEVANSSCMAARRSALLSVLSAVVLAPDSRAAAASPAAELLPEVGLLNGRLRACSSTFNCASTSSKSADQYLGPWLAAADVGDASSAAKLLVDTLRRLYPTSELVASDEVGDASYRRVQVAGRYDLPDEVEFLARPTSDGLLITLRSTAGGVRFFYPFMTPLSDGGLQTERLARVREALGWRRLGCELVECFAD